MAKTQGFTIWFTGLSGAGKSTLARRIETILTERGQRVEVLDGDEVRENLSKGLGFSKEDRDTNIRRIAYVAKLVSRNGAVAITAAISPYREIRDEARAQIGDFVEVYVSCALDTLVQRDVKGLYAKALRGEIAQFTGVSDPYEEPLAPEVTVNTDIETPEESVAKILAYLETAGYLASGDGRIPPHGGRLINRIASEDEAVTLRDCLPGLPRLTVGRRARLDLEMIGIGAFSPLEGFMGQADYESVVANMRLANGLPWSIPITLAVSQEEADALPDGQDVALADEDGRLVGLLHLTERYGRDVEREALNVYRTTDPAHPGVRVIYDEGPVLLAGPVTLLGRTRLPGFETYDLTPAETRQLFTDKGWRTIVGFQTRNPIHRAHEYITKVALESTDGLLLHPLVGATKDDDIPADVRMRCYEALLASYYPQNRTQLSVLPAAMRYAGPREAIFHALMRKNYGCTHFIVGRDHAGVGNYYGTYDAQHIFSEFAPGGLGITPMFFENAFYSTRLGGMATDKTAPPAETDERVSLSGTKVREMLRAGELPPSEFTRPEVARILVEALRERQPAPVGD